MINIAIVGCGVVMKRYVEVFQNNNFGYAKIVAVCDINEDLAIEKAKTLNANPYFDLEIMFRKENIDLTIILTSSGLHYKHTKLALENGSHTLTEKPIALRINHAKELLEISEKKGLMAGVAFQNRYNLAVKYIKNQINGENFGKKVMSSIKLIWCRYPEYYENNWHGTWEMDGGVISQQAIHHIDILQYLGGKIKSVCASFTQRLNKLEADDTTVAVVEFEDGSLGTIEATTAARPVDFEASFTIIAEQGMAKIGGIALNKIENINLSNNENTSIIIEKNSEEVENGFGNGHDSLIKDTLSRLKKNNFTAPISIEEGLESLSIVHGIYKSCETRSWINISDYSQSEFFGKKQT